MAPVRAVTPVPRVALIVGPVGSVTNAYRRLADEAAQAATAAGAEVVKVYSPDATWPAVKRAVAGASIIVYLGHGNGWPSHYRDALYPPTQNGFGLNPVAGGDDSSHQYFGEDAVARLKPAPNAVVILSHLCYASGNSEPGLPEGSQDVAIQRVDNYASGFLRAGAKAVIAEAALGPAYYVRNLLRAKGSVEKIWRSAPTAVGRHAIAIPSVRTPGYAVRLDPERANGGYTRSLVARGLTAAELRASAMGVGGSVQAPLVIPSLATAGLRFAEPLFKTMPIAGTTTKVTLPLAAGRTNRIPAGAKVSIRWDPIQLDAPPAPAPTVAPSPTPESTLTVPSPSPSATPSASASDAPSLVPLPDPTATVDPNVVARFERPHATDVAPAASPSPSPSIAPVVPVAPEVDLVVPERIGSVVIPVQAVRGPRSLAIDVAYPAAPGLYRLVATLHTPEGVAYDAATQTLLTPVLVRVGGSMAVAYGVPPTLSVAAGSTTEVALKVLNAGSTSWDPVLTPVTGTSGTTTGSAFVLPTLVATWVSVDGHPVPDATSTTLSGEAWAPGGSVDVVLGLEAPAQAGTYLLLVDVVTPESGPLSSQGSAPALVRVTVNALSAPVPSTVPAATPGSSVDTGQQ